ncbi:hypothetical protein [Pectinatus brassicae]|uniref:Uncharacterized protein n=1 Tax=Pectinatus brassicae TaxID=862415 RepID=A0A840URE5_9FIRM|nr:hypothetical protein [Pectinatus brassicae]MBB5337308.1 hypothetical protein [Pectinatus brassicae]
MPENIESLFSFIAGAILAFVFWIFPAKMQVPVYLLWILFAISLAVIWFCLILRKSYKRK